MKPNVESDVKMSTHVRMTASMTTLVCKPEGGDRVSQMYKRTTTDMHNFVTLNDSDHTSESANDSESAIAHSDRRMVA